MEKIDKALMRLHSMNDWLEMESFDERQLMKEMEPFKDEWKPYNVRKPNNRWGLSITSLDGGLSGIPDLDSVYEYNKKMVQLLLIKILILTQMYIMLVQSYNK